MIGGRVDGGDAAIQKVARVTRRVMLEAKRIFTTEVIVLEEHVKSRHLTRGTGPDRLAVRTGNLRSSTRALPVEDRGDVISSGIGFGSVYARPHIGPRGQVTTIRAKKGKFLAIPLDAAKTKTGVARGGPRSDAWGETFVHRTEEGKLFIFGKAKISRGPRAGMVKGDVTPLFLLVKQVRIPARVHPEDILAWEKPRMIAEFRKIGIALREA